MTNLFRYLLAAMLSLSAFMPSVGFAKQGPSGKEFDSVYGSDLALAAGHVIEIKSYDSKSKTYQIASVEFPGEGDSTITLEGLKRAVESFNLAKIQKAPASIVGNQYKLDRELSTLFDEEIKMRGSSKGNQADSKRKSRK